MKSLDSISSILNHPRRQHTRLHQSLQNFHRPGEVASSIQCRAYDIENVRVVPDWENLTFTVDAKLDMERYKKAVQKKMLRIFSLKPAGWDLPLEGILKQDYNGKITFSIPNGFDQITHLNLKTQKFCLIFRLKTISFDLQRVALQFMEEHELHGILIKNARFSAGFPIPEENIHQQMK